MLQTFILTQCKSNNHWKFSPNKIRVTRESKPTVKIPREIQKWKRDTKERKKLTRGQAFAAPPVFCRNHLAILSIVEDTCSPVERRDKNK